MSETFAEEPSKQPLTNLEVEEGTSLWSDAWHRLKKNRMAVASLVILVRVFIFSTRLTLTRSLSMDATPSAVSISVGQSEHSVTVMAEIRKDLENIPSLLA